jgi:hypothetical protein
MVPEGVQGWDRYAYGLNNPLKYVDPNGHFPIPPICPICFILNFFGITPDYRGLAIAEKYMNPKTDSAIVAAGIAVQSQWYGPWDTHQNPLASPTSSGLGIAQVSDSQMIAYGLSGLNQDDPEVAIQAMTIRIEMAVNACKGCSARDQLIVAALAQNGYFQSPDGVRSILKDYMQEDGKVNWASFFDSLNKKGNILDIRAIGHHQYDTRFMLRLFMNNLKELHNRGWTLPDLTENDWKYIENLQWGSGPHTIQ